MTQESFAEEICRRVEAGELGLDGVMSPQTRLLASNLGAKSVHMYRFWALTPPEWECPGCGRTKAQIARVGASGALLCHLVEHHDHAKDLIIETFRMKAIGHDQVVADEIGERFAKRAIGLVAAYDDILVCVDCNNLDALAKSLVGAHRFFSFSASEMREFVVPCEHAPHGVDEQMLRSVVWPVAQAKFRARVELIEVIATKAASNDHWFQEALRDSDPVLVERRAKSTVHLSGGMLDEPLVRRLCGGRTTQAPKGASYWREQRYPAARKIPQPAEVEYVRLVDSPSSWGRVSDDWCCPGCARTKVGCVRLSNDKKWFFKVDSRRLYQPGRFDRADPVMLCNDCLVAATDIGREAVAVADVEIGQSFGTLVTLTELRSFVRGRNHARHMFDGDAATQVVERIADSLLALEYPGLTVMPKS